MQRFILGIVALACCITLVARAQKADKPAAKAPAAAAAPAAGAEPAKMDCGKMIADHAVFPAKLAELHTTIADGMEAHIKWMSANKDKESKAEVAGLKKMVKPMRDLAASLKKQATEMEKAKDWAPAPHDMKAMPAAAGEAMTKQMALEKELGAMITRDAAEMDKMMKQMQTGGGGGGK